MRRAALLVFLALAIASQAAAQDAGADSLRLLCTKLNGGDLTGPGGIAAFRQCLTQIPVDALNPNALRDATAGAVAPPRGFGRDSRRLLAGAVTKFQAVGNTLYILVTDGKLWRATVGAQDGKPIESDVALFQVVEPAHVFVQTNDGRLWLLSPSGGNRKQVADNVLTFEALRDGTVYTLGRDRQLWRQRLDKPGSVLVDANVQAFQAIDGNAVAVLGTDGKLWREHGNKDTRESLAVQTTAFHVVGDTVFVLAEDRTLWRKTPDGGAERIDAQVAWFHPVDATVVYVLARDGRLWRDFRSARRRELVDTAVAQQDKAFQVVDPATLFVLTVDHQLWLETMPSVR